MGLLNWLGTKINKAVQKDAYGTTAAQQAQYDEAESQEPAILADGTTITYIGNGKWQTKTPAGKITITPYQPPL